MPDFKNVFAEKEMQDILIGLIGEEYIFTRPFCMYVLFEVKKYSTGIARVEYSMVEIIDFPEYWIFH